MPRASGRKGKKIDKKIIFIQREQLANDSVPAQGVFQVVNLTSENGVAETTNSCEIIEPGKLSSFRWKLAFSQTAGNASYMASTNWSMSWALYIIRQTLVEPNVGANTATSWPFLAPTGIVAGDVPLADNRLLPWNTGALGVAGKERVNIRDVIAAGQILLGQSINWNASTPASGLARDQEIVYVEGSAKTSRKVEVGDQLVLQFNGDNPSIGVEPGNITCCGMIQYFFVTH